MIFTLIISILWTFSQAWIDANHFKREQYFKDHKDRFISRCLVGVMAASSSGFYIGPHGLLHGIVVACVFWFLFDATLNKLRGKGVFYRGTEAKTDKLFSSDWVYIGSKVIALLTIIFIFLKY